MPIAALSKNQHHFHKPKPRKHQPRSAGASSRPMRNENIADLVRFFQAQEEPLSTAKKKSSSGNMDLIKAGQRRLRNLNIGQTKTDKGMEKGSGESSSLNEKYNTQRRRLMALQREGLVAGLDAISDKSRPSQTKQDVEAIGRPWLDDALASITGDDNRSRSQVSLSSHSLPRESLSLGDLAALVEFSVPFPESYLHESSPPPYQAEPQSRNQAQNQTQTQFADGGSGSISATVAPNDQEIISTTANDQLEQVPHESCSRDRHVGDENSAAFSRREQEQKISTAASPVRQDKTKLDTANNNDTCCKHDCDCDDSRSLAVLLRATEKLGAGKKRKDVVDDNREQASNAPASNKATTELKLTNRPSSPEASHSTVVSTTNTPHSLNQGVTDTPLLTGSLWRDTIEQNSIPKLPGTKVSNQTTDPLLPESTPSNKPKNGPIPLRLVADFMPSTNDTPKSFVSEQQPSTQALVDRPDSQTRLNCDLAALQTRSASSIGANLAVFPRPRHSRSATPDVVASPDLNTKGKKKARRPPLYVMTNAAPLPPPARPLPLIPQSADSQIIKPQFSKDENGQTPTHPLSAPLDRRDVDQDSPILGANTHILGSRRSWIGLRPLSRSTSQSNETSDVTGAGNEDQAPDRLSPTLSRPESRKGRADHVHALRMRDLDVGKNGVHTAHFGVGITRRATSDSSSSIDSRNCGQKHRVSAVPGISLPKNPPTRAQITVSERRRNSTASVPGSVATTHGYEAGVSRSVSVASRSNESLVAGQGKSFHATSNSPTYQQRQPESPILRPFDEERNLSRARSQRDIDHMTESELKNEHYTKVGNTPRDNYHLDPSASLAALFQHKVASESSSIDAVNLVRGLESRVFTLERQNRMLQAALLAALDVGVSRDPGSIYSASSSPSLNSLKIPTVDERSMLSKCNTSVEDIRQPQGRSLHRPNKNRKTSPHATIGSSPKSRGSFETMTSLSDKSEALGGTVPSDAQRTGLKRDHHQ